MEFEHLLKDLIQNEPVKMKKYVLFMLHKFSQFVKQVDNNDDAYLPLLFIKKNRLGLVYKDNEIDDFEYIFTDYEEILIILQKHFNEGKNLYFYFEPPEEIMSRKEIMKKIDEALKNNNEEAFHFYSLKLIKRGE